MEFIKYILSTWYAASFNLVPKDFLGGCFTILVWVCNGLILYVIYAVVIKPILYKTKRSVLKIDENVTIVDKRHHTTNHTTYITVNKTTVPIVTMHHHYEVSLKGGIIDKTVDSKRYYDKFEKGQKVRVFYKEVYETFRFSPEDKWKLIDHEIEEVSATFTGKMLERVND